MNPALPGWVATYVQVVPIIPAVRAGGTLPSARRWTAIWSGVLLLADLISYLVGQVTGTNLWLVYLYTPIATGIALWTLSLWHSHPLVQLTYRLAIPLSLLLLAACLLSPYPRAGAENVGIPALRLLVLAAAAYTLVSRTVSALDPVTRQDWFWISLGIAVYYAFGVLLHPFVAIFEPQRVDLVRLAYYTNDGADIIAFLLITAGMLCPLHPTRSGGSS